MFRTKNPLEDWLGAHEHRARHLLCWSGVASPAADVLGALPVLPLGSGAPAGDAALLRAVADAEGVPAEEVVLAHGAGEADALAVAVATAGADVLVERPTYPPLLEVARRGAARVRRFERRPETGWRVDVEEVERMLGPDTRLVVLADPHNPTGAVVPDRDLVRLAEACAEVGAYLLVDEVFRRLADRPLASRRTLHPRILATGSLTKAEGLGGLRTGWLLAPAEVAEAARDWKLATTGPNARATQALALRALDARPALLARANGFRRANLARMRKDLDGKGGWTLPAAGVAAAVPCPDDRAFAERLLAEEDVLVVPGSTLEAPGFLRVGFGIEPVDFEAGWARVAARLR